MSSLPEGSDSDEDMPLTSRLNTVNMPKPEPEKFRVVSKKELPPFKMITKNRVSYGVCRLVSH